MHCEQFKQLCEVSFADIREQWGLGPPLVAENNTWYCTVQFVSNTIGVEIVLERRDFYIDVSIYRLHSGKIPTDFTIKRKEGVSVRSLLDIRAPDVYPYPPGVTGRTLPGEEIKTILEKYANALGTYGKDLLDGDFSILPQVTELLRSRMP